MHRILVNAIVATCIGSAGISALGRDVRAPKVLSDTFSGCAALPSLYSPYFQNYFVHLNLLYFTLSMWKPASGPQAARSSPGETERDDSSLLSFRIPGKLLEDKPPREVGLLGDLDMWWNRTRKSEVATGSVHSRKTLRVARELETLESRLLLSRTIPHFAMPVSKHQGAAAVVAPSAPTNAVASAVSTTSVRLTWGDNSNNETGFQILRRKGTTGGFSAVATVGPNVKLFTDSNLAASTSYSYEVVALNGKVTSKTSNIATTSTMSPPVAPAGLTATSVSPTSVQLHWADRSNNETGFQILKSLGSSKAWTVAGRVAANATGFLVSGLSANTPYTFEVVAQGSANTSATSGTATATTGTLTAKAVSPTSVQLLWTTTSTTYTGFQVQRKVAGTSTWTTVRTVSKSTVQQAHATNGLPFAFTDTGLTPNTNYVYQIVAQGGSVKAVTSNTAVVVTPATAASASNLVATPASTTSIQLTWTDNSNNETGFQILRQTGNSGTWDVVTTVDPNTTSYADTGLQANVSYTYEVVALLNTVTSAPSNPATSTVAADMSAPAPASNLAATPASTTSIQLAWSDNSSNETGFEILRQDASSNTWTPVTTVAANTTSYTDTGLQTNSAYTYEVVAMNGSTAAAASNSVATSTLPSSVPGTINVSLGNVTVTSLQLAWTTDNVTGTGYQVQRADANTGQWHWVATLGADATSYTDTSLVAGTDYSYEVIATNNGAISTLSTVISGTTMPAAPTNLTANQLTTSGIQLNWTDSSPNETGFQIQRQDTASSAWAVVATVSKGVMTYTDANLPGAGQYSYQVLALNGGTTSAPSNSASASTLQGPAAATGLQATILTSSQVQLSWADATNDATGFKIARSTDGVNFTTVATVGANVLTYTDSGLTGTTTYYYLVVATNQVGDAAPSNMVSVQPQGYAYNASGFTQLTPAAGTITIYVSSSQGSDSNNGSSPSTPLKTLQMANAILNNLRGNGHPVWLMLKCGDTFTGSGIYWHDNGNSRSAMSLIGSYGTGARPIVDCSVQGSSGVNLNGSTLPGDSQDNLAIIGINFYQSYADPNSPNFNPTWGNQFGINMVSPGSNILIEDNVFNYFDTGASIQSSGTGTITNLVFRRNIVTNNYPGGNTGNHSQGLFLGNADGVLIQDNVFDHNGWIGTDRNNPTVAGGGPTIFNHNVYIQFTCLNVSLVDNISANASSHGAQLRPGGLAENNLFIDDPISLLVGTATVSGVVDQPATVTGNVVLDGNDIDSNDLRGTGIDINQAISSASVANNLVAHSESATPQPAISVDSGASGVTVANNTIYGWAGDISDSGAATVKSGNTIDGTGYANPNLGLGDYNASLGGVNSQAAFLAAVESRAAGTWNTAYTAMAANNYIRAGFGLPPETQAP